MSLFNYILNTFNNLEWKTCVTQNIYARYIVIIKH